MTDTEKWLPIIGFETDYEISNHGRVRRISQGQGTRAGYILKGKRTNKFGHLSVTICTGGVSTYHLIHRLVAQVFISNPNNYPIINHIDNDPRNNHYENLEWTTHKGNSQHAAKQGRMTTYDIGKIPEAIAEIIRARYISGGISQAKLAKEFNVCSRTIWLICNKKRAINNVKR